MSFSDIFDEEQALATLLKEGVLFCNQRFYSEQAHGNSRGQTTVLFVILNDVFMWGCADAEDITLEELPKLYAAWEADHQYGPIKWACKKVNLQPQPPLKKMMIAAGVWNDELEALSRNPADNPVNKVHDNECARNMEAQEANPPAPVM